MRFKNRKEAGGLLAENLKQYEKSPEAIILGLPRGGCMVAFETAKKLKLPMDVIVVRKIGAPGTPEFAIGAIDELGKGIFNVDLLKHYKIPDDYLQLEIAKEKAEAQRRLKTYRGNRKVLNLENKIAIIVDDGMATGFTMQAAVESAKAKGAKKVIIAIPVAPPNAVAELKKQADEVISLHTTANFFAVGQFYDEFSQTEDEEVINILYRKAL